SIPGMCRTIWTVHASASSLMARHAVLEGRSFLDSSHDPGHAKLSEYIRQPVGSLDLRSHAERLACSQTSRKAGGYEQILARSTVRPSWCCTVLSGGDLPVAPMNLGVHRFPTR